MEELGPVMLSVPEPRAHSSLTAAALLDTMVFVYFISHATRFIEQLLYARSYCMHCGNSSV